MDLAEFREDDQTGRSRGSKVVTRLNLRNDHYRSLSVSLPACFSGLLVGSKSYHTHHCIHHVMNQIMEVLSSSINCQIACTTSVENTFFLWVYMHPNISLLHTLAVTFVILSEVALFDLSKTTAQWCLLTSRARCCNRNEKTI